MAILEGRKVTKSFGALLAVDNVDFRINEGEILGLIGPNGAGKTTLVNLISGVYTPTRGEIEFKGQRINGLKSYEIARMGIARTFQIVRPFSGMTVKENVAIGAMFGKAGDGLDLKAAFRCAEECLEFVKLIHRKDTPVSEITTPDRKRLELAKALAMEPELLLLDEVMAGLNPKEVEGVMALIEAVNKRGKTILVIEHVMKAVMGISHRILVLHHGQKIAEGSPQEIVKDGKVIEAYLGEKYARAGRRGRHRGQRA